jgi:hypothetical protein
MLHWLLYICYAACCFSLPASSLHLSAPPPFSQIPACGYLALLPKFIACPISPHLSTHLPACLPWPSCSYLVLFLKFIASVVPTIEYDYTMAAGGQQ